MISIIIPVYNSVLYLDHCIKSVVGQIYEDWECILIDDGSTDYSGLFCDKWKICDSRIRVIHQPHQGVSVARNNGIEASTGEYVVFIDSDDWVEPNYLQDLFNYKDGCELVVSGLVGEQDNGEKHSCTPLRTGYFTLSTESIADFIQLNKNALLYGPVNKLFLSKIIKENKIRFPDDMVYGEDLLFSFHYLEFVENVATVKNLSYHYSMRNQTLSRRFREDKFDNDYKLWTSRRDFMEKKSLWTAEMQTVMYTYLWGQLYDGIFYYPYVKKNKYSYLRRILSIPEISELKHHKELISCSMWIKHAILYRFAWLFFLYFIIRSWNLAS